MKSITISIPVYNNAETIFGLIVESSKILSLLTNDYEIVVINDGSDDETMDVLQNIKDDKVKVFTHNNNEGFGRTLKEVFTIPTKEWIFFIPGDGQISPKEIFKLKKYTNDYDLILGLRNNRQDGLLRKSISFLYNCLVSLVGFKLVRDVNSVVLCNKKVFEDIEIRSNSAFVHAEIFLKVVKRGFKICEVKIDHMKRKFGKSGAMKIKVIIYTIIDFVKYIMGVL
jgi:glycosyltransferase involved in cell wall biosynthesis